jgi:hypothetical protein
LNENCADWRKEQPYHNLEEYLLEEKRSDTYFATINISLDSPFLLKAYL